MHKIRDNKWNRRFCKWMASLLMAALLVNQSSVFVLAEKTGEEAGADTVTVTDEETGNPGADEKTEDFDAGEDENTDMDADTAPDIAAEEETEGSDAGEGEDADDDIDMGADTDGEDVSDVEAEDEGNASLQDDEAGDVVGDDAVSPAAVGSTFDDGVLIYKILSEDEDDRQVEVAGHGIKADMAISGDLDIPFTVQNGDNKYTVVRIGDSAFASCGGLTSITIPESVTSIGDSAFASCGGLTSITIPDGVTSIGDSAFASCGGLTSITIPSGVTSIGDSAFASCVGLTNITIPDNVVSIGNGAFAYCSSLKSATIAGSIGDSAFSYCSSLESVTMAEGVISIGGGAFSDCSSLKSITIPDSVTSIGGAAFSGCSSLKSITIPDSITRIRDYTFAGCSGLESITIPNSVTDIDLGAFEYCGSLKSITIPGSVTGIAVNAFQGCGRLESVTMADGVTIIGESAFRDCSSLESITIPSSVTSIAGGAFGDCSSLESVTILNDNISIDGGAFSNCEKLKSFQIAITENITGTPTIWDGCFFGCPDDRYLTFLTEDGTAVLSDETALAAAVKAYDAADGIMDGKWYGWKLPDVPDIPDVPDKEFTITASAGPGGSVSPDRAEVKSGANQRFIITPEEGYRISSVLVDGVEVLNSVQTVDYTKAGITDAENNAKYYDFENVTSNHTLAASFEVMQTGDGDDSGPGGTGGGDTNDTGGTSDGSHDDNSGSDNSGSAPVMGSDTSVISYAGPVSDTNTASASKDSEPKTGDASHMEIYATIAMIAGLFYILLSFVEGKCGMTEEEKQEVVAALMSWAKKGSFVRKYAALAAIFLVLVYYHSIGKRTSADWKEVYAN